MKNYSNIIGVDISKKTLDICILSCQGASPKHLVIENSLQGIHKSLKPMESSQLLFCMEDTGVYGLYLYQVLSELGIDFSVVPAIHIKKSKGLRRGKSDKTDAKDIANFALTHRHELSLYELPDRDLQELKLFLAERERLVKTIKVFGSHKESTCYIKKDVKAALCKHSAKTVKFLKAQLKDLEASIKDLIRQNELMNNQMKLLKTIPGIGEQTALQLLLYSKCFKAFDNWRQLACYAGLAPFPYQSGSSIKGKSKVSPYAQRKLKTIIHTAAVVFKRHDSQAKQYFERKIAEGKHKMSVINALRCKLIARAFAVINRGTPFVNTQKYAS